MQLLVSGANILIDFEEGQLLKEIFQLSYQFAIPDILYHEELASEHGQLIDLGLQIRSLTSESLSQALTIIQRYPQPSRNDCFALMLAKQEDCPLLTGDKDLRSAAEKEGTIVYGTIWLVEEMITQKIINTKTAKEAYKQMKTQGRRLPWDTARRRLQES
ncbi:MAG: PIN domain-containing protein [Spirochaetia bacterium]